MKVVEYRISKRWDDFNWWYRVWTVVEKRFLWWTWQAVYQYGGDFFGVNCPRSFKTKEEAEAQIEEFKKYNPIGAKLRETPNHVWAD